MALHPESCVVLGCDVCDRVFDGGEGVPFHFASEVEAHRTAGDAGWLIKIVQIRCQAVCTTCVERVACASLGHSWSVWVEEFRVGPPDRLLWRYCADCGLTQRTSDQSDQFDHFDQSDRPVAP